MSELSDKQWEKIRELVPEGTRRIDGRGRPWRDKREVMDGVLWICEQVHPGKIYQNVIHPTRLATEGSSSG